MTYVELVETFNKRELAEAGTPFDGAQGPPSTGSGNGNHDLSKYRSPPSLFVKGKVNTYCINGDADTSNSKPSISASDIKA